MKPVLATAENSNRFKDRICLLLRHSISAFDNLDVIEWSQSTNTTVGDTVYIYVGEKYKSIMFKCEVVGADMYGNRSTDDYPYYKDLAKDPNARYMKLTLVEKYSVGQYPLRELKSVKRSSTSYVA